MVLVIIGLWGRIGLGLGVLLDSVEVERSRAII